MKLFELKSTEDDDDLGKVPAGTDPGLDDEEKKVAKKAAPAEDDSEEPPADDADDDADAPTEDDTAPNGNIDFDTVIGKLGFEKSKKDNFFAFGRNGPVTLLSKSTDIGGNDINLQYVINPNTGAWKLNAGLQGHDEIDMIEVNSGNNPQSLYSNLKKKQKITPLQVQQLLHPPEEHNEVSDEAQPSGDEEE